MTTTKSILIPLQIAPGVQPSTDKTAFATPHYTMADKIRFRFGFPQKIGGWYSIPLNYGAMIAGVARTLFSAILSTAINTVIGTNSKVYALSGSLLTNITPLSATTVAISGALATDYGTLGSNPIATVSGSSLITVTDTNASKYVSGDLITFAGATAFNGLSTGNLNAQHEIHTVGTGNYTVLLAATANATSSGGGASVVRSTGRIIVTATAHGQTNGKRVKILAAAATGGITAIAINLEFIIHNVTTNTFDIMTTGTATSHVTGAGGASTTYQVELAAGAINQGLGVGFGAGMFGPGLYGTALISSTGSVLPRTWFMDRFGTDVIMTPGNQGGLYSWGGSNAVAPALISGAPAAINYSFVSNNIIVTFGAGGIGNRIFTSDQANMTQWIASSSNQVFDDTVVGAGKFISHVPVAGNNLIFTANQTYFFGYTGFTAGAANGIWNIQQLENNIGIIAPMARCIVLGVAYWMGQNNFYMYGAGNVTIIPSSDQTQSTMLNYVFKNINRGQASKCFAWYNEQFDEIWFHYPSANSNECDSVARLNRTDLTWTPDTFDRTCAEYPNLTLGYPRLISSESIPYAHEQGVDADGVAMPWSLTTNLRGGDFIRNAMGAATTKNYMLTGFVPDSQQTGDINVEIIGQRFPQSPVPMFDKNYDVSPDTEFVNTQAGARLWKYKLSGETLGQAFTAGQWMEFVQESSPQ